MAHEYCSILDLLPELQATINQTFDCLSLSHLDLVDGGLVLLLSGFEQRLGVFNHLLDGLIWLQLDTASGRGEKKKK